MRTNPKLVAALAAIPLAARVTGNDPQSAPAADTTTLVAAKAATAPVLDGTGGDAAWRSAKPLVFDVANGMNFGTKGGTTVSMKAVTAGDTIYFLIEYADPTQSLRRGPYQKQADGSWKKLKDADDKGGDDNVYYEDKWSLMWNINDSVAGFNQNGCAVMCHAGEPGKPYGNKYTSKEGELGDMWHLKSMRNGVNGQVDDQYVDHTRFDAQKSPNAGRKGDPGGPDYKAFNLVNGKPEFMSKDGKPANKGGSYPIKDGDQVAFDDSKFKAGDEVSSYIVFPLKGDRGDIKVGYRWDNGVYTYEFARKLVTGSKFDVQFEPGKTQYFGFAAFDNAQVRHAWGSDVLKRVFAP